MSTPSDPTRFTTARSATAARPRPLPVEARLGDSGPGDRCQPTACAPRAVALRRAAQQRAAAAPTRADVLLSLQPDGSADAVRGRSRVRRPAAGRAPALSRRAPALAGPAAGLAAVAARCSPLPLGMWFLELHPAQTVARMLPQQTREAMGRNVVAAAHRTTRPARRRPAAPRSTGSPSASPRRHPASPMPVRVVLLDWALVNAFAMPGGQIILTRGLVQTAGSPDEVAGVLAHELGHAHRAASRDRPGQGHGPVRRRPAHLRRARRARPAISACC